MGSPPDDQPNAEKRRLGAIPGEPAVGRGPAQGDDYSRHEYDHPAAGWGAARSVASVLDHAGDLSCNKTNTRRLDKIPLHV